MKKQLLAVPKFTFDSKITNDYIKEHTDIAFISILDPDNDEKKFGEHPNFLQVKMWDVEKPITALDGYVAEPPSDEVLKTILRFIKQHEDKHFIVHCSAGISRSGAVIKHIHLKYYMEVDRLFFDHNNMRILPNNYILHRLYELDQKIDPEYYGC